MFTDNKKLKKALDSWEKVPYKHMGQSRGGVDCTKLMALILIDLGILSQIETSYYSEDWMLHGDCEILITAFFSHLCKYVDGNYKPLLLKYREGIQLQDGDVLGFSMNSKGLTNHAGMYYQGDIFHVIDLTNASFQHFGEDLRKKSTYIFRIVKK